MVRWQDAAKALDPTWGKYVTLQIAGVGYIVTYLYSMKWPRDTSPFMKYLINLDIIYY